MEFPTSPPHSHLPFAHPVNFSVDSPVLYDMLIFPVLHAGTFYHSTEAVGQSGQK